MDTDEILCYNEKKLIGLSQQRPLASLIEGGGPRSGGGSVLK